MKINLIKIIIEYYWKVLIEVLVHECTYFKVIRVIDIKYFIFLEKRRRMAQIITVRYYSKSFLLKFENFF